MADDSPTASGSSPPSDGHREGSLEAPTRKPIRWKEPEYHDEAALFGELERVFDICHGCRRCFSLCHAFPTLFDLIDESDTMEVDGVDRSRFWDVVDHCYLCDLCYMTKCPYVPPHPWDVDFPHLMLRAKAVRARQGSPRLRDRVLSSTDLVGRLAGIPVVAGAVNGANRSPTLRRGLEAVLGVHRGAVVPEYHARPLRARVAPDAAGAEAEPAGITRGRVALFATCYGNRNAPSLGEDLVAVFRHNRIPVTLAERERCCGMPKLELGDLDAVEKLKDENVPALLELVDAGFDIVAPIPSCVLMFKQELPLMFPDDEDVRRVADAMFDPFEYLALRHREGKLSTEFPRRLGKVAYHVACHLRVQNMGLKTKQVLELVPETEVVPIERCSGHDGTYAVKKEFHPVAVKLARPVVSRVEALAADHFASDCPMAGAHIASGLEGGSGEVHPMSLLRTAYGI